MVDIKKNDVVEKSENKSLEKQKEPMYTPEDISDSFITEKEKNYAED